VSWLAPIKALRWALGNRVKVASAASAASATLTRLSTPVRSYAASGKPLGVEITAPQAVPLDRLNQLLAELGEPPLAEQDYRPAQAA
jgi:hypothetical protein